MTYLRVTVYEWDVAIDAPEGRRLVALIASDGMAVLRSQPGFIRYRLMRSGQTRSVAVHEWESEALGVVGAARYRDWLEKAGIRPHIIMTTEVGPVLVANDR